VLHICGGSFIDLAICIISVIYYILLVVWCGWFYDRPKATSVSRNTLEVSSVRNSFIYSFGLFLLSVVWYINLIVMGGVFHIFNLLFLDFIREYLSSGFSINYNLSRYYWVFWVVVFFTYIIFIMLFVPKSSLILLSVKRVVNSSETGLVAYNRSQLNSVNCSIIVLPEINRCRIIIPYTPVFSEIIIYCPLVTRLVVYSSPIISISTDFLVIPAVSKSIELVCPPVFLGISSEGGYFLPEGVRVPIPEGKLDKKLSYPILINDEVFVWRYLRANACWGLLSFKGNYDGRVIYEIVYNSSGSITIPTPRSVYFVLDTVISLGDPVVSKCRILRGRLPWVPKTKKRPK